VSASPAEDWLLFGEGFDPLVVLVGGDGEVVRGGGGERIRLGVILTIGLMWFGIEGSERFASGEGVDDRVTSGRQPGVSAISRIAPG
jgi:hypothetical protein